MRDDSTLLVDNQKWHLSERTYLFEPFGLILQVDVFELEGYRVVVQGGDNPEDVGADFERDDGNWH